MRDEGIDRRDFLKANAALAAASAVGVAGPATAKSVEVDAQTVRRAATTWSAVQAEDLEPLLGQRFRVTAPSGARSVMTLVETESLASGPARPSHLSRSEGVVAVFESRDFDLVFDGSDGLHRVSHPRFGTARVMLDSSPKRSGQMQIELVLN